MSELEGLIEEARKNPESGKTFGEANAFIAQAILSAGYVKNTAYGDYVKTMCSGTVEERANRVGIDLRIITQAERERCLKIVEKMGFTIEEKDMEFECKSVGDHYWKGRNQTAIEANKKRDRAISEIKEG